MGDNADFVRRLYVDGLIDSDTELLIARTTPEVEYVNPPEAIEPGTRRGLDSFRAAIDAFQQPGARHELVEVFDGGDVVVASVVFRRVLLDSDTEVAQKEAHTWTFREGLIARLEWGRDLGAALSAAGIEQ